jgi:glutamine---fructose-6-phosphate transaminase (isomerizing)
MCGIVGYIGRRQASSILLDGLRRLEYRGYDSAGMALMNGGSSVNVIKRAGRIDNLSQAVAEAEPARGGRHRPHPLGHPWRAHG